MNSVSKAVKLIAVFAVKVCIAAGLIYWLVSQNRLNISALLHIEMGWAAAGWSLLSIGAVLLAMYPLATRLALLTRDRKIPATSARCLGLTLIGSFIGAVLPGLVGGDVVKAVYLCADVPKRRSDAVAVVIVDRIFGLYALFLLASIAAGVAWCFNALPFQSIVLLGSPAIVAATTLGFFMIRQYRPEEIVVLGRFYGRLPEKVRNLGWALHAVLQSLTLVLQCLALSLVSHGLAVIGFVAAARMLNDNLSLFSLFVLTPLAMVMNIVPLTPGGIGIAEGAFSFLFEKAGSLNGANVGLLGRALQYVVFSLGGVAALVLVRVHVRKPSRKEGEDASLSAARSDS